MIATGPFAQLPVALLVKGAWHYRLQVLETLGIHRRYLAILSNQPVTCSARHLILGKKNQQASTPHPILASQNLPCRSIGADRLNFRVRD